AHDADVVVMAAAPADFRPAQYRSSKIKKTEDGQAPVLELATNPDIAAELGATKRTGQVLVAFAAETHDALVVDGHLGPTSEAALVVDGHLGPTSEAALVVDGHLGPTSEAALVVDGHLGPTSEAALASGRGKLVRKRADLIVVNEVGPQLAFGT